MARFITDMGAPLIVTDQDGNKTNIGRYGVWDDAGRHKPEVITTGDDLDALQAEYGPDLRVFNLTEGAA